MTKQDNEYLKKNIRENLIALRQRRGFTQSDIAKMTGKSENAVGSWEQGLSLPDLSTLYRLSKIYLVTMEYFYENENRKGSEGE